MATAAPENQSAEAHLERRQHERRDRFDRFRLQASERYAAETAILDEVIAENESLESGDLRISTGQLLVCQEIAERNLRDNSIYAVERLLKIHRFTCQLREQCGDPAVLERAEAELAEAKRVELSTAARLEDIAIEDEGDEAPALSRQIAALSKKLATLIAARRRAQLQVERIKSGRERLRNSAPEWLRSEIEREVNAVRRTSPIYHSLQRVKSQIQQLQQFTRQIDSSGPNGPPNAVQYARSFCPQALRTDPREVRPWDREKADIEMLRKFCEQELPSKIEALERERRELKPQWKALVADIEKPLDDFVQYGVIAD
jgi:hypothetical protein